METSMVTGRIDAQKKERGNEVLSREGMNASQAINLMYDRLVSGQSAAFLAAESQRPTKAAWERAARVVDSIAKPCTSRLDEMTRSELKAERLRGRGLL